jgi:hypothetical protein
MTEIINTRSYTKSKKIMSDSGITPSEVRYMRLKIESAKKQDEPEMDPQFVEI